MTDTLQNRPRERFQDLAEDTRATVISPAILDVQARLRDEIDTLRQLLEVNEATAISQAADAETVRRETKRVMDIQAAQGRMVHAIIGAGADSVIVLDENYVITYMNRQAIENGDGEMMTGLKLLDVYPGMESTPFWPRYRSVMEKRVPIAFEDFYAPDDVWYQVNAAPVGRGIALFLRDVTDRRVRDAALQRTEKLAAVGRLASSISHEINNPLESVTNLLYLIQTNASIDDETRTYAQLASSELARVSHIVTQTLKFHRQSTDASSVHASEILDSVLSLYHGRVVTLNTKIRTEYDREDKLVCFTGDMRQVFANLIGNALDATAENKSTRGSVRIRTRTARDLRTNGKGVRVTIADNGSGMTAATQRSLYEPFFTTKGATGTGLGLWVSHEILRNHNATIRVRSNQVPGRSGTVFSIFFPD